MPGRESEPRSPSSHFLPSASRLTETDLVGCSVRPSMYGFFRFRSRREQFQQHFVTLPFEFCDRTPVSFLQYASDNCLFHLGTELSDRAKILPPRGQWP